MKPFDIPVVALGPGSQTGEGDEELNYPDLPREMNTYLPPLLPEPGGSGAGLREIAARVEADLRARA